MQLVTSFVCSKSDEYLHDLFKSYQNGRLLQILLKLGTINERSEVCLIFLLQAITVNLFSTIRIKDGLKLGIDICLNYSVIMCFIKLTTKETPSSTLGISYTA